MSQLTVSPDLLPATHEALLISAVLHTSSFDHNHHYLSFLIFTHPLIIHTASSFFFTQPNATVPILPIWITHYNTNASSSNLSNWTQLTHLVGPPSATQPRPKKFLTPCLSWKVKQSGRWSCSLMFRLSGQSPNIQPNLIGFAWNIAILSRTSFKVWASLCLNIPLLAFIIRVLMPSVLTAAPHWWKVSLLFAYERGGCHS